MKAQRDVCRRYGAGFDAPDMSCKLGISASALQGKQPLNGLRHPPENGTNGWYIWGGEELSADPDFFMPLHGHHLQELCVSVLPYLALPPGWRFLIAPDHEDVWYDGTLLAPAD
ncbi:MAG TPA: hypothetical protein VGO04_17315 [Ensifer sp.]|jgi:hypothetical protein|uniref:immunity protein Imm33 domain-containing protein n=1 Tax=Ensifer sp. TaxID=1872086 RepID=UPI002E10E069|nr:hypothetical protein [Ensifer sp.]